MVRSVLLGSNQHANKLCCAAETSTKFHRFKIHSTLENTSPHFEWYGKNPIIRELRTFGCDIYPITSSPKKLYAITHKGSLMGYKNSRATMKWWDPHTNKLKSFSSAKFDEHNNKFCKGWSPGSELMPGKNISTLPTLNIDRLYHPFIKDDIFEVDAN